MAGVLTLFTAISAGLIEDDAVRCVAHIVHTFFNPNPAAVEPAATPDEAKPQGTSTAFYEDLLAKKKAAAAPSDDGEMGQMLKLMKMMKAMKEAGIEL